MVKRYNTFKNDNTNENGLMNTFTKDPGRNRLVKNQNTKITDVDNAAHQTAECRNCKIGPSGAQYYFCFDLFFLKQKNH